MQKKQFQERFQLNWPFDQKDQRFFGRARISAFVSATSSGNQLTITLSEESERDAQIDFSRIRESLIDLGYISA